MNASLQTTLKRPISTRAKVIAVIDGVQNGQSLSLLLDALLANVEPTDKGFAHELTLGTLRHWHALKRLSDDLAYDPISDTAVLAALHVGFYQLLYLQTPDYAAISQTVEAVKELGKGYGAGLINAILRKVATSPAKFAKKANKNHSLPNWLAKQLKADWRDDYDDICQVLRCPTPIFVRANTAKISHSDYKNLLMAKNIAFDEVQLSTHMLGQDRLTCAFRLTHINIPTLPHFGDGYVMVQDLHAQLAVSLVFALFATLPKNVRILDACTAPAGKLTHLLSELVADAQKFHVERFEVVAIDNDKQRLSRAFDNVARLGFDHLIGDTLTIEQQDATTYQSDTPFDVIMLDAPCSATGVIARHPDISLLRDEEDVAKTTQLQATILDNLWGSLAVGGYLVYITCSILKAENDHQLALFLDRHYDATPVAIGGDWGIDQAIGRQCLPVMGGGDGFYYGVLQKSMS